MHVRLKYFVLLRLTFFDQLTYYVTLCGRMSIEWRDFYFLLRAFVAVFLDYLACVVYTKTIIHLGVGESGGYLPPLWRIIVKY